MIKNILLHGWRGISHSFSVVNRYQAFYLSADEDTRLFHQDAYFYNPTWNGLVNSAPNNDDSFGFITRLNQPGFHDPIHAVYSIVYPFIKFTPHLGNITPERTVTFMVTEFGLSARVKPLLLDPSEYTRGDDLVVTPSNWSRDKLLHAGFQERKVMVIPHGFEPSIYYGLSPSERAMHRANIGFDDTNNFIFFNNGAMTANKGIESLVCAFARLASKYPHIRLVLKDNRSLYGLTGEKVVGAALSDMPQEVINQALPRIKFLHSYLSPVQLNAMYNIADCYVSPYYAEGFNLPVLEAMAAGTQVIVTRGGSTEDFCPDAFTQKIDSRPKPNASINDKTNEYSSIPGFHLEHNFDSLLYEMQCAIERGLSHRNVAAANFVRDNFTWQHVTQPLAALLKQ